MDFITLALYALFTWTLIRAIVEIARGAKNTSSKLPPGPAPVPVIGNLLKLGDMPHKSLAELAKAYGPLMTLHLPGKTTVVVSSAAMAKEALQKQDVAFSTHRAIPDCVRALRHDAVSMVWLPASRQWRNLRKICNSHVFAAHVLDGNSGLRRQKVQELLAVVGESCRAGSGVEIGKLAFVTALNLLSNTILSKDWVDLRSESAQELKETAWAMMEEIGRPNLVDYFPALSSFDPQGIRRRLTAHFGKIFEVFDTEIDRRLRFRKQQSEQPAPPANSDVLDILLNTVEDSPDQRINDVRHLLLDLFIAGSDTTSSTVEWGMAELLRNPMTLAKIQAEMEQTIGKGDPVEEKDIARLPYLQAVVKETFRLHPAAPLLLPRQIEAEVKICGFSIPKDTQVLVNAWAIGRDPETWEDPGSFRPERFIGLGVDVKGQNFELIPFGAGRRICPGLPLAVRMVHLMLGSLVHTFEWRLEDGVVAAALDMDEKFGITLQKRQPLVVVPLLA